MRCARGLRAHAHDAALLLAHVCRPRTSGLDRRTGDDRRVPQNHLGIRRARAQRMAKARWQVCRRSSPGTGLLARRATAAASDDDGDARPPIEAVRSDLDAGQICDGRDPAQRNRLQRVRRRYAQNDRLSGLRLHERVCESATQNCGGCALDSVREIRLRQARSLLDQRHARAAGHLAADPLSAAAAARSADRRPAARRDPRSASCADCRRAPVAAWRVGSRRRWARRSPRPSPRLPG